MTLATGDATLEAAPGELTITFTPPDATWHQERRSGENVSSGIPLNLPAGTYTVTARTSENSHARPLSRSLRVSPNLDLSLAPSGMTQWDDPAGWKQEGFLRSQRRRLRHVQPLPASGTFVFSAMPTKGHRLQWVLDCVDPNNYVLFQMDDRTSIGRSFAEARKRTRSSSPTETTRKPSARSKSALPPRRSSTRSSTVTVGPSSITGHNPAPTSAFSKFGFYIPGNSERSPASPTTPT